MSAERELLFQATRKDFKVDWFSGTGAGGQYRNKTQNCCRLTHIPTGIQTTGQEQRDRISNQRSAFQKMAELLKKHWLGEQRKARFPGNPETIRTYHEPDNRVVDHASGKRLTYAEVVDKSDISELAEARRASLMEKAALERYASPLPTPDRRNKRDDNEAASRILQRRNEVDRQPDRASPDVPSGHADVLLEIANHPDSQ